MPVLSQAVQHCAPALALAEQGTCFETEQQQQSELSLTPPHLSNCAPLPAHNILVARLFCRTFILLPIKPDVRDKMLDDISKFYKNT